jgi:glycosyltransferase involved in cell wall biosynthesis
MQAVTMSDLQVFITTYNRPDLLKLTLESVLCQTKCAPHIAVLDNGMLPSTGKVVDAFCNRNIARHDSSSLGPLGNLLLAQRILSRKYVLLLHDDDQIHPDYLQLIRNVINAHPAVTLLTCRTLDWPVGGEKREHLHLHRSGHIFTQKEFATFVYNSGHPSYSLAVYEAEAFKKLDIKAIFGTYGKWGDGPLMIEAVGNGSAAMLMDTCGWMGTHPGQDTRDPATLPHYRTWINREKLFCAHLGDNPCTFPGLSFCLMNYRHLKSGYKRRVHKEISFRQYLSEARAAKALTGRSLQFRFLSPRFIQKIFLRLSDHHFKKTAQPLF